MRRTAHEFWESVLEEIDDGGFFQAAPGTVVPAGADQTRQPADAALIHKRGLVVVASVYALLAMLASIGVVLVLVVA